MTNKLNIFIFLIPFRLTPCRSWTFGVARWALRSAGCLRRRPQERQGSGSRRRRYKIRKGPRTQRREEVWRLDVLYYERLILSHAGSCQWESNEKWEKQWMIRDSNEGAYRIVSTLLFISKLDKKLEIREKKVLFSPSRKEESKESKRRGEYWVGYIWNSTFWGRQPHTFKSCEIHFRNFLPFFSPVAVSSDWSTYS